MARCSLSKAKLVSAFVVDRVSGSLTRRGYAAAASSQGVGSGLGKRAITNKGIDNESNKTSQWVPDPKTGCYRPEGHADNVDMAELREALLGNKVTRH